MSDSLMHYGMPRRSGRYPYGSGETPYQHGGDFYSGYTKLKKETGMSDSDIAKLYGMSEAELKKQVSIAFYSDYRKFKKESGSTYAQIADHYQMSQNELRKQVTLSRIDQQDDLYNRYEQLRAEGKSRSECAKILGVKNESTLRSMENKQAIENRNVTKATIELLRRNVDEQSYIDVGDGVASSLGITKNRLDTAVQGLKNEGYKVHNIHVQQVGNPYQYTTVSVLCKPGTTWKEVRNNTEKIGLINERFETPDGLTARGIRPPKSISGDRIQVVTADEGGKEKDGLIELRRGVEGLDMGNANYAQVRIAVDGTHYLKGVAVYADDLPKGIDIRFNSSKSTREDSFKEMKNDPNNPFGTSLKYDKEAKVCVQKGYLNIVNEQGDWQEWSKTLSSQFLSKQPVRLAKEQLSFAKQERELEFKEIMSLTNPTIRKHELLEFAEKCDTAAIHLKAAAMPGQSNSLILPINSLKPTEVYAPNYKNGTEVVLIRHPHGGTFEIPMLKVNNRNEEARKVIGISNDAIGIHHSVAAQLSGADFDGDTVIVIPNNSKKIFTRHPFEELQNFDTKSYKLADPDGVDARKVMSEKYKGKEMGVVSNLVTDMTIQDAPAEDVIKAVKYSMVVIDSPKHKLDYRRAKKDCEIELLKKRYQQHILDDGTIKYGGASTLISRAKSEVRGIEKRKNRVDIDPETGKKIFYPSGETYVTKSGEIKKRTGPPSTQMRETDDAFTLVSSANNGTGTTMERVYAQYANSMKAMANQARKAAVHIQEPSKNPEMSKKYSKEVESLNKKLVAAKAWSPKERNAQLFADHVYRCAKIENPNMTDDDKKKVKSQALITGRARLGRSKPKVDFTDREWEAIQNGAIAKTTLSELLKYADSDKIRERALPKQRVVMTPAKVNAANAKLKAGYSYKEVAQMLGVSVSTVQRAVNKA